MYQTAGCRSTYRYLKDSAHRVRSEKPLNGRTNLLYDFHVRPHILVMCRRVNGIYPKWNMWYLASQASTKLNISLSPPWYHLWWCIRFVERRKLVVREIGRFLQIQHCSDVPAMPFMHQYYHHFLRDINNKLQVGNLTSSGWTLTPMNADLNFQTTRPVSTSCIQDERSERQLQSIASSLILKIGGTDP